MLAFEHQSSLQTLAAGIAEYHETNPGFAKDRKLSLEANEFFRCHDAVHVVYGCGNALNDEAVVKISSIFGTTGGFGVLRGYTLHESLAIYRTLHVFDVAVSIFHSVVIVPRTLIRCLRQNKRWPWHNFETYMQMPLREIRQEFGIRVAHVRENKPVA